MTSGYWRVEQRVHQAWNGAIDGMKSMSQAIIVKPEVPNLVFRRARSNVQGVVKLSVGPVVFNVPERANHGRANLYIVVTGWLSLYAQRRENGRTMRTNDFGTRVAYFRLKDHKLWHVFGAHYDFDTNSKGHPVFHMQVGPQMEIGQKIGEHFGRLEERVNELGKIARTVRTPTAQMDFFSVFTQICADHLLWRNSPPDVHRAFERTRESCNFFVGAAHKLAFLRERTASECYRSIHWYGS